MPRALRLAALGGLAWAFVARRRWRHRAPARALVGFADGSVETVSPHAYEHEALVAAAREALVP
jgi:hypothetical protein